MNIDDVRYETEHNHSYLRNFKYNNFKPLNLNNIHFVM